MVSGRPRKYHSSEEAYQGALERNRKYRASEKGKEWYAEYRKTNKEKTREYDRFRYLMKQWSNLYDAMFM